MKHSGWVEKETRHDMGRMVGGMLLLAVLAVCGYAGAAQPVAQMVSIPMTYEPISAWEISEETMESVRAGLERERQQEIALLDSVLSRVDAPQMLVDQALMQKTQLAARMETEAKTKAALSYMGYPQVNVLCGADKMTLFVPWQYASDAAERVKLIAAAADQAQIPAEHVKIILPKNE